MYITKEREIQIRKKFWIVNIRKLFSSPPQTLDSTTKEMIFKRPTMSYLFHAPIPFSIYNQKEFRFLFELVMNPPDPGFRVLEMSWVFFLIFFQYFFCHIWWFKWYPPAEGAAELQKIIKYRKSSHRAEKVE